MNTRAHRVPDPGAPSAWPAALARRLWVLWPLKAVGTALFIILFFQAYFYVLHHPSQPAWVMPRIWLDDWVPFTPHAFAFYVSLWVYVSLPPALAGDLRALLRFGRWVALLSLSCLIVFWAWPTRVPTSTIDWATYPNLAFLKSVDASGNACPSLHVACAVFANGWLQRQLREINAPRGWAWASHALCLAIAWSTLATLQHVALDAIAGAIVGALFAWLSLRTATRL